MIPKSNFIVTIVWLGLLLPLMAVAEKSEPPETLNLEDVVEIALENNYGIRIARSEEEIDRLNHTLGNAGMLPSISASGTGIGFQEDGYSVLNGDQTSVFEETGELTAGVSLDWTIFDGLRMFSTYSRLSEVKELGETNTRIEVEQTLTDVIAVYYEIVQQEKLLNVLENSIEFSEERRGIAETMLDLGSGSEYDLLLARTDLNTDRAEAIRQEVVVKQTKYELLRLLDLESDMEFDVSEEIELLDELSYGELYDGFQDNNSDIKAARQRQNIARHERNEVRRERYPEIELNIGYQYEREEVRNSIRETEELRGPFVGATLRVDIFDGLNMRRRVQVAGEEYRTRELEYEEELASNESSLSSAYENYLGARQLIELEQENLELAQEALDIALEQYQLATITPIELRETQRIVLDTETRLIDAQYEAKIAETEILRLSGMLPDKITF